jgi:putative Holliday junction resolvase
MSGRIMALDFGSKRIGIAFSDPLQLFAKAHSVIPNDGFPGILCQIQALTKEYQVSLIVVGMPYAIDGSNTPKTDETMVFFQKLQESMDIRVTTYDERYSSAEAEAELKKMGKSWQEARKMVDAMAAAMILRSFLTNME